MPGSSRSLLVAALLLGASVIWNRPGPVLLAGGDAGCYGRVAKELDARPLSSWTQLTLGGEPFFEHPPLGLWLEGAWVGGFGATPGALVGLARLLATLTLLVLAAAATQLVTRRPTEGVEAPRLAAMTVLGALLLPGFLYESQIAMLESPLSLALALGLWALAGLTVPRAQAMARPWRSVALFAVAVTAGFWVKGPPVAVLLGVLAVAVMLGWVRAGLAALAVGASLGLLALSVLSFEWLRAGQGLEPFFPRYLARQVLVSMTEGRHNANPDPWFYMRPTLSWYGPAVGALALGGLGLGLRHRLRWLAPSSPEALVLGAALWLGVVVGFSLPVQKYQWYIHPGLVGASLVMGAVLAMAPRRVDRVLIVAVALLALLWPLCRFVPWESRLTETQRHLAALQAAEGPRAGDAIEDCSGMDWWVSGHLVGFLWDARRVDCGARAAWRFDGERLLPSALP